MAEDQSTGKRILGAAEVKRSLVRIAALTMSFSSGFPPEVFHWLADSARP